MTWVYLIRHGQAGLRHNYDSLSELGRLQARLAGEYLVSQRLCFSAIYSGSLRRQAETAELAVEAYTRAGIRRVPIVEEPRWNEFDMEGVMAEVVPLLARDDPDFRRQHEELSRAVADENSELHRRWTPCDTAAMRAWMEGRYPLKSESWPAFCQRIAARRKWLLAQAPGGTLAVFTSAVPISLCIAEELELSVPNMLRLAGALYNSAITAFRVSEGRLGLISFNTIPHLADPTQRTFR